MERKRWLQFVVSAVLLVFSVGLDLYFPQVKDVLCTALPVRGASNFNNYENSDSREPTDNNSQRIK